MCSWNATDILVMAATHEKGEFREVEAIKGDTQPGTVLVLKELTPPDGLTVRLADLAARFDPFSAAGYDAFEVAPPITEKDRIVVFLRRPGAAPEYSPRPDIPANIVGWQPAN